jgi:predicted RNA binding protein with dsRBD fold (UPF0201 family)
MKVKVKAHIKSTEDRDKVKLAILNIFPDLELVDGDDEVLGDTDNLDRFAELVRNQRIRDSTRAQLFNSKIENEFRISLNKQAAFKGKVSFGGEGPMGNIEVVVSDDDLMGFIDSIAHKTADSDRAKQKDASA